MRAAPQAHKNKTVLVHTHTWVRVCLCCEGEQLVQTPRFPPSTWHLGQWRHCGEGL